MVVDLPFLTGIIDRLSTIGEGFSLQSSFPKRGKTRFSLFLAFLITTWAFLGGVSPSLADMAVDIRADGLLMNGDDKAAYVAAIEDGSDLTSISVSAGETALTVSPSETRRIAGSSTGCELLFSGTGVGRFNPQVTLHFRTKKGTFVENVLEGSVH